MTRPHVSEVKYSNLTSHGIRPGPGFGRQHGLAAFAPLIGVLLFLAWQIVTNTMAIVYQVTDPERALRWNPSLAGALVAFAERRMFEPAAGKLPQQVDFVQARILAERALRAEPLAESALTILGRIAESENNASRAAALISLAGERSWRDATAQRWLVKYALSKRDFATALLHLDAVLRTHPESRDQALPLLTAFVSDQRATPALAHTLETNPPWRAWFLNQAASSVDDHAALRRLYAELQVGPRPPTEQDLQPYLDRLVRDGLYHEAYAIWAKALPPRRRPDPGTLYNGAFQYQLSGSEFDWKIVQSVGADVEVVEEGTGEPRALRVEFSGARVDFHNVTHLFTLPPGTYRLTGQVEAEALRTERGVWWRIYCFEPPSQSLGQTELVSNSTPWRDFTLPFTVPAKACQAQVLQLELPARIDLEQVIAGVISYRNMAIVASQRGAAAPQL